MERFRYRISNLLVLRTRPCVTFASTFLNWGTWILSKYLKDCIISTRKMVTCPKLHKFCHRATGQQNGFQRINWSISSPNQKFLSLNILRQKHRAKKICSGCSHGNRVTNANSPKLKTIFCRLWTVSFFFQSANTRMRRKKQDNRVCIILTFPIARRISETKTEA